MIASVLTWTKISDGTYYPSFTTHYNTDQTFLYLFAFNTGQ